MAQPSDRLTIRTRPAPISGGLPLKLILWLMLVLVLPFAAGFLVFRAGATGQPHGLQQTAVQAAKATLAALDRLVSERSRDVLLVSALPQVRALEADHLPGVLDLLVATSGPTYELAFVANQQGQVLAVNGMDGEGHAVPSAQLVGSMVSEAPWFRQAMEAAPTVVVEDFHDDPLVQTLFGAGSPVLSLSVPILNDLGSAVGVLSVRLSSEPFQEVLARHGEAASEALSLVLLNGRGEPLLGTGQALQLDRPLLASADAGETLARSGLDWRVQARYRTGQLSQSPIGGIWLGLGLYGLLVAVGTIRMVRQHLRQETVRSPASRAGELQAHEDQRNGKGRKAQGQTIRSLEQLLAARTEELNEVRRELERVRAGSATREKGPSQGAEIGEKPRPKRRLPSLAQTSEAMRAGLKGHPGP
ncbi:MAG: cache domain-containing protein [Nitrospirota bacterium]